MDALLNSLGLDLTPFEGYFFLSTIALIIFFIINVKTLKGEIINIYAIEILNREQSDLYLISSDILENWPSIKEGTAPLVCLLNLDIKLPFEKIITKRVHFKIGELPEIGNFIEMKVLTFFSKRKILAILSK